mmetsp:Transcript_3465/g.8170  ORF Transcript_3465/g.8170 Transcript_3465/m.8170 type:complete len:207 (+) Transcript_3465:4025-4645(+)
MINDNKMLALMLYAQCNIGTTFCDHRMTRYVCDNIRDSIYTINLVKTINKMTMSLNLMYSNSIFQNILIVDPSGESRYAIKNLCLTTGLRGYYQNYYPGNFVNTKTKDYFDPTLAITIETSNNKKLIQELSLLKIPIISFCNTDCNISFIDLVIPLNTRSKYSKVIGLYIYTRLIRKFMNPKINKYFLSFKDFVSRNTTKNNMKKL